MAVVRQLCRRRGRERGRGRGRGIHVMLLEVLVPAEVWFAFPLDELHHVSAVSQKEFLFQLQLVLQFESKQFRFLVSNDSSLESMSVLQGSGRQGGCLRLSVFTPWGRSGRLHGTVCVVRGHGGTDGRG